MKIPLLKLDRKVSRPFETMIEVYTEKEKPFQGGNQGTASKKQLQVKCSGKVRICQWKINI